MSKNDPPKDTEPDQAPSNKEERPREKLPPPPPFQPDRDLITYIEKDRRPREKKRPGVGS